MRPHPVRLLALALELAAAVRLPIGIGTRPTAGAHAGGQSHVSPAIGRLMASGQMAGGSLALAGIATHPLAVIASEAEKMVFEPRGITTEDTVIFIIGCVPFVWAGIEFWRRIAVGDPFGTGDVKPGQTHSHRVHAAPGLRWPLKLLRLDR